MLTKLSNIDNINYAIRSALEKKNWQTNFRNARSGTKEVCLTCKGLRKKFLDVIRRSKNGPEDKYSETYAEGITQVAEDYLREGVKGMR